MKRFDHHNQSSIFDAIASREARDRGLAIASKNPLLPVAREKAKEIARQHGEVYSDLVIAALIDAGYPERALANAGGAVFKDGNFYWTGYWHRSTRVIGKGNLQRIWRLK